MTNTAYTREQMEFAKRISRALANAPADKRPLLETVVESVLIGAGIAAATSNQSVERSSG